MDVRKIAAVCAALLLSVAMTAGGSVGRPGYSLGGYAALVTNTDNLRDLFIERNGHGGANFQVNFNTCPGSRQDAFNEILNYPTFGFGLNYDVYSTMGFVNNTHLGSFVDIYTFMEYAVYKSKVFSAGFLLDLGVSLTNVYYNPITNPYMYNIGKPFTVFLAFGPQFKFRPSEHVELALNTYWFHHSNGNLWMPNFGLNDLAAGLAVRYNPEAPYTEQVRGYKVPHVFQKGLKCEVYATTGVHACKTEFKAFNQMVETPSKKKTDFRSHPRLGIGFDMQYRYSLMCSSGVVADGVYNWGVDELRKCDEIIYGKEEVEKSKGYSPFNLSMGLIHEFHYGNMSVFCAMCAYLFRKVGIYEDQARFFQRAGMRFYMPRLSNMFLGCCIRATKFNNADYFEFQMGVKI